MEHARRARLPELSSDNVTAGVVFLALCLALTGALALIGAVLDMAFALTAAVAWFCIGSPLLVTALAVVGASAAMAISNARTELARRRAADLAELSAHIRSLFIDPAHCRIVAPTTPGAESSRGLVRPFGPNDAFELRSVVADEAVFFVQAATFAGTPFVSSPAVGFTVEPSSLRLGLSAQVTVHVTLCETSGLARVSATTHIAGPYLLSIFYRGKPIGSAPIRCTFAPGAIDPRQCAVRGAAAGPVPLVVDEESSFVIEARDRFGNAITTGGAGGEFALELGANHIARTSDLDNGTYVLAFVPLSVGPCTARLRCGGVQLASGLFELLVLAQAQQRQVLDAVSSHKAWFRATIKEEAAIWAALPVAPEDDAEDAAAAAAAGGDDETERDGFAALLGGWWGTGGGSGAASASASASGGSGAAGESANSVTVSLSPKQLSLKRYRLMGLLPQRVGGFKVGRALSITLVSGSTTDLLISEGSSQVLVALAPGQREVLYATVQHFVHARQDTSADAFQEKRAALYHDLLRGHTAYFGDNQAQLCNLRVHRDTLVKDAYKQVKPLKIAAWRKKFHITQGGSEAMDLRTLFKRLGRSLFSREHGLFDSANESLALFHPVRQPVSSRLSELKFAGRLAAKSLYDMAVYGDAHIVGVNLSRSLCKLLVGLPISPADLVTDDPVYFAERIAPLHFNSIRASSEYVFAEPGVSSRGTAKTIELVRDGASLRVTEDNKARYLALLAHHRLYGSLRREVDAFLSGFFSLVPEELLSAFDDGEMEMLLCGLPRLNVADLRAATVCERALADPASPHGHLVAWFWEAVESFSLVSRARLLQRIVGSLYVPPGGYGSISPPITLALAPDDAPRRRPGDGAAVGGVDAGAAAVVAAGSESDGPPLPTLDLLLHRIELPKYRSFEQLMQCLLFVVGEGAE